MRALPFLLLGLATSAQASTMLTINSDTDELMVYSTTGAFAEYSAGWIGFDYQFGDAAYDDAAGLYYIIVARPTPALYKLDLNTGAYGLVAYLTQTDLFAADVDPTTGNILAVQYPTMNMFSIDPNTGVETFVATTGVNPSGGYWDDALDGLVINTIGLQEFKLVTRTGVTTTLASYASGVNDSDFDLDTTTGTVWGVDWSPTLWSFSYPAFGVLLGAPTAYHTDATAIIDNPAYVPPPSMQTTSGSCPGVIGISATHLTPGGQAAILNGSAPGSFTIPTGACAGNLVGLAAPHLLSMVTVPPSGTVSGTPTFNAAQCAKYYQVVDIATCRVTNVYHP